MTIRFFATAMIDTDKSDDSVNAYGDILTLLSTGKAPVARDNGGNSAGDSKSTPIVMPSSQKATPSTSTSTPIVTPQG